MAQTDSTIDDSGATAGEKIKWQQTKKGKGRVAPRMRASAEASIPIPKLTAVSHRQGVYKFSKFI